MTSVRPARLPRLLICALAITVLASSAGLARAAAPCFFLTSWKGHWKTAPDAQVMYISVSRHVYRLDLAVAYPLLKSPWAVLRYRDSSSTICSPSDFRLVVSDQIGVKEQVIVKKMTRLTPGEVAALPKKLRP